MAKQINKRAISDDFLKDFTETEGKLKTLLDVIKNDPTLIMCLRGNDNRVDVYYRGLLILQIKRSEKVILRENGIRSKEGIISFVKVSKDYFKKYIIKSKPSVKWNEEEWAIYFQKAKYKIDKHCAISKSCLEKEIQQIMFRENSYNCIAYETDYFIFDMEFAQGDARFDALAIFLPKYKENNNRSARKKAELAIIELKAGQDAIGTNNKTKSDTIDEDKASLSDHYKKVKKFVEHIDFDDMSKVFWQMEKLGMINTNTLKKDPKPINIDRNRVQFILALANYNSNSEKLQEQINKIEKERKSETNTKSITLDILYAISPCLGYGLYEKYMLRADEILEKFEAKKPKLIIHRGTKEIGGSAVEINNHHTRLLFDFGIPLETMEKEDWKSEDYKLPIKGLYKNEKPEFDAVFLSHAHPDHYGLMQLINPEIPIYVSKVTYDILTKIAPKLPKQNTENLNLHIIKDKINFGNMFVKAIKVDHSIAGACGFEIKTDGKTIVYTGDIRFHGRTSWSEKFKKDIKDCDYLIMEGTTLGRKEQKVITEEDLEKEFVNIFNQDKLPLIQFSPQSIDRFVTVYKACKKTGKTLVIDPYTCYVLETYKPISKNIPQFDWDNIRVNFAANRINNILAETGDLFKYKAKKITIEEIITNPEKFVVKGNWTINKQIFDRIDHNKINIVYSMWKGYLDRPNQFDSYKDLTIIPCHTSGHAYIEDLQKLVKDVQPKKLIPIHTECKNEYKNLFESDIVELDDGQELRL